MYGLEKGKNSPATFEFDLEKDLKKDPTKAKHLLKTIEERMHDLKGALRQGAESKDFDHFGVLLHGYAALQRVLGRVKK